MATAKQKAKPTLAKRLTAPRKKAGAALSADALAQRDAKIRLAYEATSRPIEEIGAEHGLSKGRISQMAKAGSWVRGDLTPRVRARAQAKVDAQVARDAHAKAGEAGVIEAAAAQQARLILNERSDVATWRGYVAELWAELLTSGPVKGKKPEKDAPLPLSLPARIDGARKLVSMGAGLIELERRVNNIVDDTPIDPGARMAEEVDKGLDGIKQKFAQVLGTA